jgi:hypothetical protein
MKDITGLRFGKLVAIRPNGNKSPRGSFIWECVCDCGNTKYISQEHLSGKRPVKSCGCLKPGKIAEDLTGKKFNRLTVLCRSEKPEEGMSGIYVYYLCRCDCGNEPLLIMGEYNDLVLCC